MIAVNIGRTFLKAYNERYQTNYSAKKFFLEKYFPLFFDAEKYMQYVTNSPFVQGLKKGSPPTPTERQERLAAFIEKIDRNDPDASFAIGFPSMEITATTSGQLTDISQPWIKEDVYLSWIGSGLGIGIQGGLSIFFNKGELLMDLYEGWNIYRKFLHTIPLLRGNQINTWNGQWIAHRYDHRRYDSSDPTAQFNGISAMKDGGLEISTQSWIAVMIGISRKWGDLQLTGYVYNLGQTNTTIGFIPFKIPQIKRPVELYEKYFGTTSKTEVDQLFGTAFGFTKACQMGVIGVSAMEPKGLREFIEQGKSPVYNEKDENRKLHFQTHQIWLLAMLNNEQLWEQARNFALLLNTYALSSDKGKKDKTNQVKTVLTAVNQKQFLDSLITIVEEASDKDAYAEMAKLIHVMPKDNVPYFLTLIRFHFATLSKN